MAEKLRGSYIFDIFASGCIGNLSESVNRTTKGIDVVRMKALGHLGVNFDTVYYGDTLTWDELDSVGVTWGANKTVKYPTRIDGYAYNYVANGKLFTVISNTGAITTTLASTLSDLGICLDIMASHQFKIYFSAKFINDAFLPAWRWKRGQKPSDPYNPNTVLFDGIKLAYVDQFFSDASLHWRCNRLIKRDDNLRPNLENNLSQSLEKAKQANILRSNIPVRIASGNYTATIQKSDKEKMATQNKVRNAIVEIVMADFLMIAHFATIMNMSKPVYEPWMLFGMWKWLCSSDPVLSIEKIFDLSPRW